MGSKSDAKDAVLKYLLQQNRPYSANDITQNLLKEFGKTAVQKALDELSSSGKIREKVYGKQKVYAPLQDSNIDKSAMDVLLATLDSKIMEDTNKLSKLEVELKAAEAELKCYENQLSTDDAKIQLNLIVEDIAKLEDKLKLLTSGTVIISTEDKSKILKENEKVVKEYRKRKRICMEMSNEILENYPKSKKAFFEEVGIELDEVSH